MSTGYSGLGYLIAAHTAFCIPFAYLPIRARLESMDLTLETRRGRSLRHALEDLPAGDAAAAVARHPRRLHAGFVISLDDVVITEFVKSGGQETLPTYMLGQLRRAVTPEINAISTVLPARSRS